MNPPEQQSRINKSAIIGRISIDQASIYEAGLWGKTDLIDWAIIYYIYISLGIRDSQKQQTANGDVYVQFSYKHFMEEMPAVSGVIKTRQGLEKRMRKLRELGLIDSFLKENKKLYVALTDKTKRVLGFFGPLKTGG